MTFRDQRMRGAALDALTRDTPRRDASVPDVTPDAVTPAAVAMAGMATGRAAVEGVALHSAAVERASVVRRPRSHKHQKPPPQPPPIPAFVRIHLALLGMLLAAAALAEGGMTTPVWLVVQCGLGVLAVSWTLGSRQWLPRQEKRAHPFPSALVVMPLYAALQCLPLPLAVVETLSPARAALHAAVSAVVDLPPAWLALSVDASATLRFVPRLMEYGVVYWLVREASVRLRSRVSLAAWPILFVALLESIWILAQELSGQPARGSYFNRNHVAGFLAAALPFALILAGANRARTRSDATGWFWRLASAAVPGALMLAAVAATRSRAGFVAALAAVAVSLLPAVRSLGAGRRPKITIGGLGLAVAVAFLYLPSENLVRRYGTLLGDRGFAREGRVMLWRETLDLIAAYPVAGCGFGAYEDAFLRYKRSAPMLWDLHAHNDYLELLAEAGIAGFALFFFAGAAVVVPLLALVARRAPPSCAGDEILLARACAGSLAAIAVHSLFDFNWRIPANALLFFWVLGLCGACVDLAPRRASSAALSRRTPS